MIIYWNLGSIVIFCCGVMPLGRYWLGTLSYPGLILAMDPIPVLPRWLLYGSVYQGYISLCTCLRVCILWWVGSPIESAGGIYRTYTCSQVYMTHIHLSMYININLGVYESYTPVKPRKQMTTPLNALHFKRLYLCQNMDFSTYEGLLMVYEQWKS